MNTLFKKEPARGCRHLDSTTTESTVHGSLPTAHCPSPSPTAHCSRLTAHFATPARRAGFTLIEMLTVIVIISILIGMLGAVYIQARNHAKTARAQAQLRELVKAWNEYYQTYTNWPTAGNDVPMNATTLSPLFATDIAHNPKAIPFLSINIPAGGNYCDPWGNIYKVSFSTGTGSQEAALRIAVAFPNRDRYR